MFRVTSVNKPGFFQHLRHMQSYRVPRKFSYPFFHNHGSEITGSLRDEETSRNQDSSVMFISSLSSRTHWCWIGKGTPGSGKLNFAITAIHSHPWQLLVAWSGRDFAMIKASSSKVAKRKSMERTLTLKRVARRRSRDHWSTWPPTWSTGASRAPQVDQTPKMNHVQMTCGVCKLYISPGCV